jgi:O-methyltransferase
MSEPLSQSDQEKIDPLTLQPFGALAAKVMRVGRTYLDAHRLYTLWQLVEQMPANARAVAEIGVYRGGSARFISDAMRILGRPMPFYVCDTFAGHVEVDETIDGLHRPGKQFTKVNAEKVARYLGAFDFVRVLQGDIRATAPMLAHQQAFGLVHVDVDVYPITKFCLEWFGARMVTGGGFVVDDYGTTTCQGVKKAVDEFASANARFRRVHLMTGQAILICCAPAAGPAPGPA